MEDFGGRLLQPLAYHHDLVSFLKAREPELWTWIGTSQIVSQSAAVRSELLRSTYRVDGDAHPEIVGPAIAAGKALGISVPISVYQNEGEAAPNAALIYVPDEAIVLLSGSIAELLDSAELSAIMGHELAHHVLWTTNGGDHLVADCLVNAVANESFDEVFSETARLLSLSTELFADRGALLVCGDLHTAVAALVKVSTGLRTVSAASYLRQAEELLSMDTSASHRTTHPETVLRAAALEHWSTGADVLPNELSLAVYGVDAVDRLDLLAQQRTQERTRSMIDDLLRTDWFRTELVLAHARAFFPESGWLPRYQARRTSNEFAGTSDSAESTEFAEPTQLAEPTEPTALAESTEPTESSMGGRKVAAKRTSLDHESTKNYLGYVLLDLATIDPDLLPASVVETAVLASVMGFGNEYESIVKAELRIKKKEHTAIFAEVAARLVREHQHADAPSDHPLTTNPVIVNESAMDSRDKDGNDQ